MTAFAATDEECYATSSAFFEACKARFGPYGDQGSCMPEYMVALMTEEIKNEHYEVLYILDTCDIKAVRKEVRAMVGATLYKNIKVVKCKKQDYNFNTIRSLVDTINEKLEEVPELSGVSANIGFYYLNITDGQLSHTPGHIDRLGVNIYMKNITDKKIKLFKKLIIDHPALYFTQSIMVPAS
ncbi:hypothetical protein LJC27_08225 [Christensenellaceae bacterium OttesenSCG-928-M15]|nr:hypothetical protein [Christensenellaceae bacterium OttesenSCG-928-M15]